MVVGVPDEKWGEAITAVVSTHEESLDTKALLEHVKTHLAGYKCPKHVVHVHAVYRSPSCEADFKRMRATFRRLLDSPQPLGGHFRRLLEGDPGGSPRVNKGHASLVLHGGRHVGLHELPHCSVC